MDWLSPLLGGLGLGAIVKSGVDAILSKKSARQKIQYEEMREAYFGLLNALHKAAVEPSEKNSKEFALWQTRVQLFGSSEVAAAVQGIIDTNDGPRERTDQFFNQMIEYMRRDLQKYAA
ncbi:hypothetical protein [Burkholderia cenocepacia]|uniref:Uncharacterized protein n=1 Tax=Burkholderia cenocepacia TaxID=95486 RepID=A0A1V2VUN0_9BURK|nr:hypothetical protein [Burkholderia cenocepacia]ONU48816.1 hypothetical protein A8E66_04365 [Burkholderia cenocepacia]ONU49811.1 hypothetical protein A8E67_38055 [Burkholderia cenocepacia]ONU51756.1 hypothetical protein A8E62_26385 [Burkholderia cenocepacia]ONU53482.1 hypothetical protein A8E68_37275 [Burkholderia cenocepacia]ONU71917.1 hypothetical protein A8E63_40045 [Burkholderia cenocepacia]